MDFLKERLFEIELYQYVISLGIFIGFLIIRKIFNTYVSKLLVRWANKTAFKYDDILVDAIKPPLSALFFTAGLFLALLYFDFPESWGKINKHIYNAYMISIYIIGIWTAYRLTDMISEIANTFFTSKEEATGKQLGTMFKRFLRIFIVIIGSVLIVQNLGYSVGSLLAGVGIGGLAVALAAQETLSNFLSSIIMLTDKPFRVGDWIQFKNVDGDVEAMGLRTTKVRTWGKSLVTIPNKLLTSDILENWSAMPKRRIKQTLSITYGSKPKQIRDFVDGIRNLLKNDPAVDQDYMIVNFSGFGDNGLEVFIYYFTSTTVWGDFMEAKQNMNLKIMELAEELGLSFAFPSRTLYFGNSPDDDVNVITKNKKN